jgi:hypothetical protein
MNENRVWRGGLRAISEKCSGWCEDGWQELNYLGVFKVGGCGVESDSALRD